MPSIANLARTAALSITLPLFNLQQNTQWAIPLSTGTPAQGPALYLLDSGSSVYWALACASCVEPGGDRTVFNPAVSKTLARSAIDFDQNYLGGLDASGYVANDTVTFGNMPAARSTVLVATNVTEISAFTPGINGVFGIGEPSHAINSGIFIPDTPTSYTPPWATLFLSHSLAPVIGIHLGLSHSPALTQSGSITFGALSPKYGPKLSWHDVPAGTFSAWQISGVQMGINGKVVSKGSFQASLDTGTTNANVDLATAQALLGQIPGLKIVSQPLSGGRSYDNYLIPCNTTGQTIYLQVGPTKISLPSSELPYPINDPTAFNASDIAGMCSSRITFGSDPWLIGGVFLKHAYLGLEYSKNGTTFHEKRLGIAAI